MKAMYRAALMVAAFVFLLPLPARSEIRGGSIEVTPFGGYNWFQDKQNLKDRPVYGGRLGYNFTPHFGIEGTVEFIKTAVDDKGLTSFKEGQFGFPMDDVDLYFYHVDAVFHFMPEGRFNPFIVAGFGGAHYKPRVSDHDMAAFNVGVGAKYWLTDHIALRADLRDYMVTEIIQETYHNVAATVGVTFAFGGRERPVPARAERVEAKPEPVAAAPIPPPAAPTVRISAYPATIDQGKCAKLDWSSTGASSASIDQGIGSQNPNGSREVCPGSTTQYTITAMGDGGTRTNTTTVTVVPPPPPPAPVVVVKERPAVPVVIDRLVLHVNFDFDKSTVRPADVAELQKAIAFIKKYPANDVSIEGHTDSKGTDKYNQALSERRAAAVKAYLLKHAEIDSRKDTITTTGLGESKPIADNKTEKGRFENRRVEILILEK